MSAGKDRHIHSAVAYTNTLKYYGTGAVRTWDINTGTSIVYTIGHTLTRIRDVRFLKQGEKSKTPDPTYDQYVSISAVLYNNTSVC